MPNVTHKLKWRWIMIPLKEHFHCILTHWESHRCLRRIIILVQLHLCKIMSIYSRRTIMCESQCNTNTIKCVNDPLHTSTSILSQVSTNSTSLELLTCRGRFIFTSETNRGVNWNTRGGRGNTLSTENLPVGNCIRGWGWALEGEGTSVEEIRESSRKWA